MRNAAPQGFALHLQFIGEFEAIASINQGALPLTQVCDLLTPSRREVLLSNADAPSLRHHPPASAALGLLVYLHLKAELSRAERGGGGNLIGV